MASLRRLSGVSGLLRHTVEVCHAATPTNLHHVWSWDGPNKWDGTVFSSSPMVYSRGSFAYFGFTSRAHCYSIPFGNSVPDNYETNDGGCSDVLVDVLVDMLVDVQ